MGKMIKLCLSVVALLCLALSTYSGPVPKEFQEVAPDVRKTCQDESGVTTDLIENAANGNIADDERLKCYLKCSMQQFGLISRKRGIVWDTLIRLAPPSLKDAAVGISQKCKDIKAKEGDLCDLAHKNAKCAYENYPDVFFIL